MPARQRFGQRRSFHKDMTWRNLIWRSFVYSAMKPGVNLRKKIAAALPGCSSGMVRAQGVVWGPEAGNSNSKSLLSALRTSTTFKDISANDFKPGDIDYSIMTSVCAPAH